MLMWDEYIYAKIRLCETIPCGSWTWKIQTPIVVGTLVCLISVVEVIAEKMSLEIKCMVEDIETYNEIKSILPMDGRSYDW